MAADSPRSAARRPAAAKNGADLLSPRFRSAAEMAGWDEESILLAALVVEDTPVRESRRKRRPLSSGGGSAGSNTRKRKWRRNLPSVMPPVVLALDDDDKTSDAAGVKKDVKQEETEVVVVGENESTSGSTKEAVATSELPCIDRLREELSCAICLEICFEPSTTPCGHSFCVKCLKHAAAKCGKRCPKCRQLISNSRSCTINTVLWNTIQLLFPSEIEMRKASVASPSSASKDGVKPNPPTSIQGGTRSRSTSGSFTAQYSTRNSNNTRSFAAPGSRRSDNNTGRSFVRASQLITTRSSARSSVQPDDDIALAYRLQQEEFMTAFESEDGETRQPQNNTVSTARANLRAMASRAVRFRARGWPL